MRIDRTGCDQGEVLISGRACGSPCVAPEGSEVTAQGTAECRFVGWEGGCQGDAPCRAQRDATARFERIGWPLEIDLEAAPGFEARLEPLNIQCTESCGAVVPVNTEVQLLASGPTGQRAVFAGDCDVVTTSGACLLVGDRARRVRVSTSADLVQLTLRTEGNGSVSVRPDGPSCGPDQACTVSLRRNDVVTVEGMPSPSHLLTSWSRSDCMGPSCSFTLDEAAVLTARFEPSRLLMLTRSGTGSGRVRVAGVSYDLPITIEVVQGVAVTVEGEPGADDVVFRISGLPCNEPRPSELCTFIPDRDLTGDVHFHRLHQWAVGG